MPVHLMDPDPSRLSVAAITIADAEPFAREAAAAFQEAYHETADPANMQRHLVREFGAAQQRAELGRPGVLVFAAREPDGRWAGFAATEAGNATAGVEVARPLEITRFYTRARWYGRGAARPLMDAVLAHARATGHDGVWLQVWEHNARARRFYEKCGFVAVGHRPFLFGDVEERDVVYLHRIAAGAP